LYFPPDAEPFMFSENFFFYQYLYQLDQYEASDEFISNAFD